MPECVSIIGLLGDIFQINFASISTKEINGETVSYRMEKNNHLLMKHPKRKLIISVIASFLNLDPFF